MLKKFALTLGLLSALIVSPMAALAQEEHPEGEWVEFVSTDGTVTFSHPAEWVVAEEPSMTGTDYWIASSQEFLESTAGPVEGEVGVHLLFVPVETLQMIVPELDATSETFYSDAVMGLSAYILSQREAGMTVTAEPGAEATAAMETEATAEPATGGAEAAATVEAMGTEEAMAELPFTIEEMEDGTYAVSFTESGTTFYGYQVGSMEGADTELFVFDAAEGVLGVAIVDTATGETDQHLALDVLDLLDSVVYTPAE